MFNLVKLLLIDNSLQVLHIYFSSPQSIPLHCFWPACKLNYLKPLRNYGAFFVWFYLSWTVNWSWVLEGLGNPGVPSLEQIYFRRAFSSKCCVSSRGGTCCMVSHSEEAGDSWGFPWLPLFPFHTLCSVLYFSSVSCGVKFESSHHQSVKYFRFINIHFGTKIYVWRKSNLSCFLAFCISSGSEMKVNILFLLQLRHNNRNQGQKKNLQSCMYTSCRCSPATEVCRTFLLI